MIGNLSKQIKALFTLKYNLQQVHNVNHYNYWNLAEKKAQDLWLCNLINSINSKKAVNVLSVFGNKEKVRFINSPKIFFTGENIHTNMVNTGFDNFTNDYFKYYDLAIGFDYTSENNLDNYIRFPLWMMYLFPFDSSFKDIKRIVENYNSPKNRSVNKRNLFASNISRHDINGIRSNIIDLLKDIGHIECAGSFRNNTDRLTIDFQDNKLKYLHTCRFNICPENSDSPGYVTEKIFESIQAGCIPIYWGSRNNPEPDVLNYDAILFYNPIESNLLYDKVLELENNINYYNDFILQKPFKENAEEVIWGMFEALKTRIKMIL